jgi:hypothetical protein
MPIAAGSTPQARCTARSFCWDGWPKSHGGLASFSSARSGHGHRRHQRAATAFRLERLSTRGFCPRAPSPAHPTGARPPHGADWPGGPDGCAGAQARGSPTGHRWSAPSCPCPQASAVESRRLGLAHAGPYAPGGQGSFPPSPPLAPGHRRSPPYALWRAPARCGERLR